MKKKFAINILDRSEDVHRSLFLEASAGTGKTFFIENLVVRLLIESKINIENILVVTFTRAATRDLKLRIHTRIEHALQYFDAVLNGNSPPSDIDYLCAVTEKGEDAVRQAKNHLEQSLFAYDEASIATIHSFCMKALKNNLFELGIGLQADIAEEQLKPHHFFKVIRDFLRTGTRTDKYSISQLQIVLREHQYEMEKVEKALYRLLTRGLEIAHTYYFSDYVKQINQKATVIKEKFKLVADDIVADFVLQNPLYKKPKKKELSIDTDEKIKRFALLCEKDHWSATDVDQLVADQLVFAEVLDPEMLKIRLKSAEKPSLHYPELAPTLRQELMHLVRDAGQYRLIIANMAYDCQQILHRMLREEERWGPDDLLKKMLSTLHYPEIVAKLRNSYQAVIIDEFQDTDPIQWTIFSKLFAKEHWKGNLYLVGDPKQSIYAFRQADIYTYLKAAEAIGDDGRGHLNTNYRSQPSLIKALNVLFSANQSAPWITLPRTGNHLTYIPVECPSHAVEKKFSDSHGSIHFFIARGKQGRAKAWPTTSLEEEQFFPFIAQEIQRLVQDDHIAFRECAVLVRDRFQAERLLNYFKRYQIPALSQRQAELTDSPLLQELIDLLKAVLSPKDDSALCRALASTLIGWQEKEISRLQNDLYLREQVNSRLYCLQDLLARHDVAAFFDTLLHSTWHQWHTEDQKTLHERLLGRENGAEQEQELQQMIELLLEHQRETGATSEQLILFLKELQQNENDDPLLQRRCDPMQDSVQIMTLHASKGLEFEIVFALGLASRTTLKEEMIPMHHGEHLHLHPIDKVSEEIITRHQQELDAEKMRLLYVGMTRAKLRLYVPVALSEDNKEEERGIKSPIELFFLAGFAAEDVAECLTHLADENDCITTSDLKDSISSTPSPTPLSIPNLVEPYQVRIPGESQFLYSFTGLTKNRFKIEKTEEQSAEEDLRAPQEIHALTKTIHTLPAGAETGILLHAILEKLALDSVKEMHSFQELVPIIDAYLKGHPLQEWREVIAEMLFHTLKKPLQGASTMTSKTFRLCDIDMKQCYRELEFLYPWNTPISEIPSKNGYLQGVIDLLFQHEEKYYIVDWKSNWLGIENDSYHTDKIAETMQSQHYTMQSAIYVEAVKRFLAILHPNDSFEKLFGGVYYLFLRGTGDDQGKWFEK